MSQYDVYRGARGRGYLLDCQSDLIDHFATRTVVPLLPPESQIPLPHIHPTFEVDGDQFVMATQLIFAIPVDRLGKPIASLAEQRYDIMRAIDMLWSGV